MTKEKIQTENKIAADKEGKRYASNLKKADDLDDYYFNKDKKFAAMDQKILAATTAIDANRRLPTGGLLNKGINAFEAASMGWGTPLNRDPKDIAALKQAATVSLFEAKPPSSGAMSNAEWSITGGATINLDNPPEVNNKIALNQIQAAKQEKARGELYYQLVDAYGGDRAKAAEELDKKWGQYVKDNPAYIFDYDKNGRPLAGEPNKYQVPLQVYFGLGEPKDQLEVLQAGLYAAQKRGDKETIDKIKSSIDKAFTYESVADSALRSNRPSAGTKYASAAGE